ncbi:hypothetical protein BHE74_00056244, partial [Ensete ventricosum]
RFALPSILCGNHAQSRVSIGFLLTVSEIKNTGHSPTVEFRSVFYAPSRKFKILAIPNVIAHEKSYEDGFTNKLDGHILCARSRVESSFDRAFVCQLGNSKYWPFSAYLPMGSRTSTDSQKNVAVINFAGNRTHCGVSIGFSCTVSKIQNTSHPDVLAYWKSYEHGSAKKLDGRILCANRAQSRVSIGFSVEFRSDFRAPSQKFKRLPIPDVLAHESSFDRFFMHRLRNSKYWPIPIVEFQSVFGSPSKKLKILAIPDLLAHVFRAPSRKLKIMAIHDVLTHGKSYEHGFGKKCDGHKLCAKSLA